MRKSSFQQTYNLILMHFFPARGPESRRPVVLRWRGVAEHQRLSGQNQEGSGVARHVLRFQDSGGVPLQGTAQAEEKVTHCKISHRLF